MAHPRPRRGNFDPARARTVGEARRALAEGIDAALGDCYVWPLLFAGSDGRLYVAECDAAARRVTPEEATEAGRPAADDDPIEAPSPGDLAGDALGIADWIVEGTYDLRPAPTVLKLKDRVWGLLGSLLAGRDIGSPPFVAEDGRVYAVELAVSVRRAAARDRALIEDEVERVRESAAHRVERLDRYLKQLTG